MSVLEGFCLVGGFLSGRAVFVWSQDFLIGFDLLSGLEAFSLVARVFDFLTYCLVGRVFVWSGEFLFGPGTFYVV